MGELKQGQGTSGYAFTGREWDAEIGLYYYRARYYEPTIGRFLKRGPGRDGRRAEQVRGTWADDRPARQIRPGSGSGLSSRLWQRPP